MSAIIATLGHCVDFAQLVKVYAAPTEGEGRYSPLRVESVQVVPVIGNPDPTRICTSIVERQNLTIRIAHQALDAPHASFREHQQQRRVRMLSEAEQLTDAALASAASETEKRQGAISHLPIKLAERK